MRILALDSSSAACSAAVWTDGYIKAHRFEAMARGQAERLVPLVTEVVGAAQIGFSDIDLFAATTGPGAFTGLRIGLATLRGLALAAGKPMLGVTSFDAVAHGTLPAERAGRLVLVLLESKRADVYFQAFDEALGAIGDPLALMPGDLAPRFAGRSLLLAGDGASRVLPALEAAGCDLRRSAALGCPDAAIVARLAAERAASAGTRAPSPLYLRAPDVTFPYSRRL